MQLCANNKRGTSFQIFVNDEILDIYITYSINATDHISFSYEQALAVYNDFGKRT